MLNKAFQSEKRRICLNLILARINLRICHIHRLEVLLLLYVDKFIHLFNKKKRQQEKEDFNYYC